MLNCKIAISLAVILFIVCKGHGAVISSAPILPPICPLVPCVLPRCPNPIPPKPGQCCPTCPLVCPAIPPGTLGTCVEACSGDDGCPHGELCCSNGCGHVCKTGVPQDTCLFNGQEFEVGDSFPSTDGCNTCTCNSGGLIACTEIACLPKGCTQGGVEYDIGESFPSDDGCNTCSCVGPNSIICTLRACPEPTPSVCPPDKPPVNCFADPCMFTECPAHPDSKCVANYCGGCNAEFFVGDMEVTDTCKCPVKGQVFKECGSACPANCTTPNPICTRQCVARCECPDGQVIDETTNTCVPVEECPVCNQGGVIYKVGDSFPAGDGCNKCSCIRPGVVVCTLIACQCPVKGQVFKECGSACPANCTTPNPICTKQCVARCECPDGQVIDETTNTCVSVEECPSPCPPVCTAAFCKDNKWGKCTLPGPREIPGCTGACQFTFCSACYFSDEPRPLPGNCRTCGGPISSERCYKRWAKCIGRADAHEHGCLPAISQTEERFRCYRYPCPLKG